MKHISKETKASIINRYNNGEPVSELTEATGIARSTIYGWLKANRESVKKPVSKKTVNDLNRAIIRLSTLIEILQKVFDVENIPTRIRLEELERLYGEYNIHNLCDALSREVLREQIQEIFDDNRQVFGSPKITAVLKSRGVRVSEGMVRQLMQDMGLISIREGAKEGYDKEKQLHKNYLNQQFHTTRPDEVWVSDITYFRYNEKKYYICVIIDLYARKVIGFKIGSKNSTQLTKSTFKLAYELRRPDGNLIFHTDNGSNYTSKTFRDYLKKLGVTQSFSRPHIPYDNSVMESFFANMKREELYRSKYRSEKEFRNGIEEYIRFYNDERPHSKNKYKTPSQKEAEYFSKQAENAE